MPKIFVTSPSKTGTKYGRFDLEKDAGGQFVILPGGLHGVKVRLFPEHIKPDPNHKFGADYFYDVPIAFDQPDGN